MQVSANHGTGQRGLSTSGSISLDVLDAWFDPSPRAVAEFVACPEDLRASPDLEARSLIEAIGEMRSIDAGSITIGAGSSEIIHRVLPTLAAAGPTLLLDPTYSEYDFLLRHNGQPVIRFPLAAQDDFQVSLKRLIQAAQDAKLVVLVNPNNPTGRFLSRDEVLQIYRSLPKGASLWVDEAYVDYCPEGTSVERDACGLNNLYVLKSLSKAYALSGIRAAYLVSSSERPILTPPWILGNSVQRACIAALQDRDYYPKKWQETVTLIKQFDSMLSQLDLVTYTGAIAASLVKTPHPAWINELFAQGLIVRNTHGMGASLGDSYVRISMPKPELWHEVRSRIEQILVTTHIR